ncbi:MAG: chemotaxis response regulator protein-glutamate methylesterase [Candidatus Omnitrophica bacterium]|nr:chemotaxis response regulator protein-glutamate methylesterase [Candidatus Omnitrophota bacterium]MBU4479500.1 chemotaxis response regulator protein-glutamate methylesterase [Candidatus Omnitrophota bacterium]MCG2702991.1 chemotaxis response regulator protein-glutamate methylesterase [Candidatus Omnitrophota bacterium]
MIRVLVVDNSAFMRRVISDIINSDDEMEVVDAARTGAEAITKVLQLRPDVVTLDIEMPDIDGLTALRYIMNEAPTPVVVISANAAPGSPNALKALELGAVDIVCKLSGEISLDIHNSGSEIVRKVKAACRVNVRQIQKIFNRLIRKPAACPEIAVNLKKVITIGASTGGPKAIKEILPYFPADIPAAFLIVQHMPAMFTKSMAERLNWSTKIEIKEAEDGDIIRSGCGYLAPGDYHMVVGAENDDAVIRLVHTEKVNNVRPSVTVTMNSAAEYFGSRNIGVLLTGMGQDGAEGMRKIKQAGGVTLAEDESTCVVYGMPRAAVKEGVVDKIVPLFHMGLEIMKYV